MNSVQILYGAETRVPKSTAKGETLPAALDFAAVLGEASESAQPVGGSLLDTELVVEPAGATVSLPDIIKPDPPPLRGPSHHHERAIASQPTFDLPRESSPDATEAAPSTAVLESAPLPDRLPAARPEATAADPVEPVAVPALLSPHPALSPPPPKPAHFASAPSQPLLLGAAVAPPPPHSNPQPPPTLSDREQPPPAAAVPTTGSRQSAAALSKTGSLELGPSVAPEHREPRNYLAAATAPAAPKPNIGKQAPAPHPSTSPDAGAPQATTPKATAPRFAVTAPQAPNAVTPGPAPAPSDTPQLAANRQENPEPRAPLVEFSESAAPQEASYITPTAPPERLQPSGALQPARPDTMPAALPASIGPTTAPPQTAPPHSAILQPNTPRQTSSQSRKFHPAEPRLTPTQPDHTQQLVAAPPHSPSEPEAQPSTPETAIQLQIEATAIHATPPPQPALIAANGAQKLVAPAADLTNAKAVRSAPQAPSAQTHRTSELVPSPPIPAIESKSVEAPLLPKSPVQAVDFTTPARNLLNPTASAKFALPETPTHRLSDGPLSHPSTEGPAAVAPPLPQSIRLTVRGDEATPADQPVLAKTSTYADTVTVPIAAAATSNDAPLPQTVSVAPEPDGPAQRPGPLDLSRNLTIQLSPGRNVGETRSADPTPTPSDAAKSRSQLQTIRSPYLTPLPTRTTVPPRPPATSAGALPPALAQSRFQHMLDRAGNPATPPRLANLIDPEAVAEAAMATQLDAKPSSLSPAQSPAPDMTPAPKTLQSSVLVRAKTTSNPSLSPRVPVNSTVKDSPGTATVLARATLPDPNQTVPTPQSKTDLPRNPDKMSLLQSTSVRAPAEPSPTPDAQGPSAAVSTSGPVTLGSTRTLASSNKTQSRTAPNAATAKALPNVVPSVEYSPERVTARAIVHPEPASPSTVVALLKTLSPLLNVGAPQRRALDPTASLPDASPAANPTAPVFSVPRGSVVTRKATRPALPPLGAAPIAPNPAALPPSYAPPLAEVAAVQTLTRAPASAAANVRAAIPPARPKSAEKISSPAARPTKTSPEPSPPIPQNAIVNPKPGPAARQAAPETSVIGQAPAQPATSSALQPQPLAPPQATSQPLPQLQMAALPHNATPHGADHTARDLPKGFTTTLAHSINDSGHARAELILEPAELGRMRFDMVTQGDQVQITLAAERPDTLELLRRHADDLRQEFRASGIDTGSLSFGQWGQQGQGASKPDAPSGFAADDPIIPTPSEPIPAPRASVAGTGLDLRL